MRSKRSAGAKAPARVTHQEKLNAWAEDWRDPNNWLCIPHFGARPSDDTNIDAGFPDGFICPIQWPHSSHWELAGELRRLVGALRHQAMQAGSQDALRDAWADYLDLCIEAPDEDSVDPANSMQRAAAFFELAMGEIDNALQESKLTEALHHTVAAAGLLGSWIINDPSPLRARLQSGAREGGIKGAETRRKSALSPKSVVAAAVAMGWPAVTQGVNKRLSLRFDCTPERIGQILRAEQKAK